MPIQNSLLFLRNIQHKLSAKMTTICPPNSNIPLLVSTDWLAENLAKATGTEIRILQAVYPDHCYSEDLIPNTLNFFGEKCQAKSVLRNQLPNPQQFAKYVGETLGIKPETHVIAYDASGADRAGLTSAPRLWYTFRLFGHEKVSVLNGGLVKWQKENRATTKDPLKNVKAMDYKVSKFRSDLIIDFDKMQEIVKSKSHHVLDSRDENRFAGLAEETAGGKSGKIENTVNLPFSKLVNPETLEFLDEQSIKTLFSEIGVDHSKPFAYTCGTGTTVCALILANTLLGHDIGSLYDGSWFEYSRKIGINPWPEEEK